METEYMCYNPKWKIMVAPLFYLLAFWQQQSARIGLTSCAVNILAKMSMQFCRCNFSIGWTIVVTIGDHVTMAATIFLP